MKWGEPLIKENQNERQERRNSEINSDQMYQTMGKVSGNL